MNYKEILENNNTISSRIKGLRILKGLSQEDLSKKINISKTNISDYENNIIVPSLETICKLADIFDCSCDYLLCRTNDNYISINDLNSEQVSTINYIIEEFRKSNKIEQKTFKN